MKTAIFFIDRSVCVKEKKMFIQLAQFLWPPTCFACEGMPVVCDKSIAIEAAAFEPLQKFIRELNRTFVTEIHVIRFIPKEFMIVRVTAITGEIQTKLLSVERHLVLLWCHHDDTIKLLLYKEASTSRWSTPTLDILDTAVLSQSSYNLSMPLITTSPDQGNCIFYTCHCPGIMTIKSPEFLLVTVDDIPLNDVHLTCAVLAASRQGCWYENTVD